MLFRQQVILPCVWLPICICLNIAPHQESPSESLYIETLAISKTTWLFSFLQKIFFNKNPKLLPRKRQSEIISSFLNITWNVFVPFSCPHIVPSISVIVLYMSYLAAIVLRTGFLLQIYPPSNIFSTLQTEWSFKIKMSPHVVSSHKTVHIFLLVCVINTELLNMTCRSLQGQAPICLSSLTSHHSLHGFLKYLWLLPSLGPLHILFSLPECFLPTSPVQFLLDKFHLSYSDWLF